MKFHKEGIPSLIIVLIIDSLLISLSLYIDNHPILDYFIILVAVFLFIIILQFFRNPIRKLIRNERAIVAPADGKIVVIEKTFESEFLKTECLQISIFMSPLNVHINRYPISGKVIYYQYHPGKKLVAWNPKSSTENERTTVAIEHHSGRKILMRQIAGLLARRIVCYSKLNDSAIQSEEMGFIKFGSRVDLFLPLDTHIQVKLNDTVTGGISIIGNF